MQIQYYQTIPELGITGTMNTPEEFAKIGLPEDLNDWSVMDIGCNSGAFLAETLKRGARYLVGIEPHRDWRLLAHGVLNEIKIKQKLNYQLFPSVEDYKGYGSDLVLLLSVTHVSEGITGQEIFDRAWKLTRRLLIVEINDRLQKEPIKLPPEAKLFGKNKDNRSVWHIYK